VSRNPLDIATGVGPLAFGDSVLTAGGVTGGHRVPNGFLDDVQLYDEVLTETQILFLYNNPGNVIEPPNDFASWISGFGLDPTDQGFSDDPDGDNLANGLEAWLGTHPGEFNGGFVGLSTDGTITTFSHPQNESPPSDLSGYYEWSPNLVDWYGSGSGPGPTVTMVPNTVTNTTTVTATASETLERLFLRVGASQN